MSGPTPKRASRSGAVARGATRSSRPVGELPIETLDPVGQRGERRLGGRGHRIGRSGGSELAASATRAVTVRPFRREWSWSGAVIPRWRIWTMALTRACRAERLATTRTRMASTGPSLVLPDRTPDR